MKKFKKIIDSNNSVCYNVKVRVCMYTGVGGHYVSV